MYLDKFLYTSSQDLFYHIFHSCLCILLKNITLIIAAHMLYGGLGPYAPSRKIMRLDVYFDWILS